MWVVTLEELIQLNLASGISASHRLRDLITPLELPLTLADRLDPYVQATYRDLWEKAQGSRPAAPQE